MSLPQRIDPTSVEVTGRHIPMTVPVLVSH